MITKTFSYGEYAVSLETGRIARQTNSSVVVTVGGTCVLVTIVAHKESVEGRDFFPLTVNYQEKSYAAGRIPGGYFKREGRPTEKETLISRLIDRAIRPLFAKGFLNEVQLVATVLSLDSNVPTDIPAMIGASAALAISGLPFHGPIAAARVGYADGQYLLNPSTTALKSSALDLVVAGTRDAILMVESEAQVLSEDTMLGALMYGHTQMQVVIDAIDEFARDVSVTTWDWQAASKDEALAHKVEQSFAAAIGNAYRVVEKIARNDKLAELRNQAVKQFVDPTAALSPTQEVILGMFAALEKKIVRERIFNAEPRIDGRDNTTVRAIAAETSVLPRTHGSALFTRGETQALVVTTLGTEKDSQLIDALEGEYRENFMLHYNFPPYCVGETGIMGSPKRREIGHGRLAKRALIAVLPTLEEFPYILRVVSEITESNGSSSMASVCGTSLALMDAGVPIKAPVAGIAMGLIKDGDRYSILTDIMGDEDHLGDMDFKVAGTEQGVTALQMDIKINGITKEILQKALDQAKIARLHILKIMNQSINAHRQDVSAYAPRIMTCKIHPDKIRDVIGKGGATIRALTEETGTSIDIAPDGTIKIAAVDLSAAERAMNRIELLTAEIEVGKIYEGVVSRIMDFGAIVSVLPGKDGLVHISQISDKRIDKVTDELSEGQAVTVKVLEIDRQGRVRLSMKEVKQTTADA